MDLLCKNKNETVSIFIFTDWFFRVRIVYLVRITIVMYAVNM